MIASARAIRKWGATGYGVLGDAAHHTITNFPKPEYGAAAFDLWYLNYKGKPPGAAGQKWMGYYGFGVPGYDPETITTKEMLKDPKFAIPLMKAIASREPGRPSPLTEEQVLSDHSSRAADDRQTVTRR